jgi:hypothetical protein
MSPVFDPQTFHQVATSVILLASVLVICLGVMDMARYIRAGGRSPRRVPRTSRDFRDWEAEWSWEDTPRASGRVR